MKTKQYEKKDGSKGYVLTGAYIGTDAITGKQVRNTIRGKNEKEIRRKLEQKIREFEANGNTKIEKVKIKDCNELIDLWLEQYRDSGIRDATYILIKRRIDKHIRPILADTRLDKLSTSLMRDKVTEFKKNIKGKLQDYSVVLSRMKAILQYGVEQELLQSNPMANIKTGMDKKDKSVNKAKDKVRYYDKSQITQILKALQPYLEVDNMCDAAFCTYIKLLLLTGARTSELLALNWTDIDFNKEIMNINKTITNQGKDIGTPKSDAGIRKIELDETAIATLKKWRTLVFENCLKYGTGKPSMVFYNHVKDTNYSYEFLRRKYAIFCNDNNIPYLEGLHCFRHTHATMYVASGGDFKTLQARLGHEDIKMTMNLYADALPEAQREAIENTVKYMLT